VAWISYLRWVVLSNVLLCIVVPVQILAAPHRPVHAVGRVALPRTGRKVRTGIPRPSRLGDLWRSRAHREREQAQGTLGTADHDTWGSESRANRVRHTSTVICGDRRSGRHLG